MSTPPLAHLLSEPTHEQRVEHLLEAILQSQALLLAELQKISAPLQRWDAAGLPAREAA